MLDATQMEISLYRPDTLRVSRERYNQMVEELDNAFLRSQLWEYYSEFVSRTPEKVIIPLRKTAKKSQVLNTILRNLWDIEVTDEIAEREDVLITREITSRRRDLFFMVGEGTALVTFLMLFCFEMGTWDGWYGILRFANMMVRGNI